MRSNGRPWMPILAAGLITGAFSNSSGQVVRDIGAKPVCVACTIELERLFTITDSEPAWLGDRLTVTRDARGRYHATSLFVTPGIMHLLDSTGRRVGSYGAGRGRGPGEGEGIYSPVFDAADTIHIFDFMLGRISVWSPSLELVRTLNAPWRWSDFLITTRGALIVAGNIPTRERAGYPLHVVDRATGAIERSFGADPPAARDEESWVNRRKLAHSANGRFWAAHTRRYVIELRDPDGSVHLILRRDSNLFSSNPDRRTGGTPGASVNAIWEDDEGLLRVMVQVRDPDHDEYLESLPDMGGEKGILPRDFSHLEDMIIDVIDPRSAELVSTWRFDEAMSRSPGHGAPILIYREAEDGTPRFDAMRARIVRRLR